MAVIATGIFWQFRHSIGTLFTDNTLVTATRRQPLHPHDDLPVRRRPANRFRQLTARHFRRKNHDGLFIHRLLCHLAVRQLRLRLRARLRHRRHLDAFPFGLTSAGIMFWLRFLCKTRKPLAK